MLKILCLYFFLIYSKRALAEVTEEEYASMPEIFHLDDFDQCMLLGEKALYCLATIQLKPADVQNVTSTWNIINEVSSVNSNYRHDLLRHGICVPLHCSNGSHTNSTNHEFLNKGISIFYTNKYKNLGLKANVLHLHCETKEPFYEIDIYDMSVAFVLFVLFLLVVLASFYEGLARYNTPEEYEKKMSTTKAKLLKCFSLPNNWQRLRSTNTTQDASSLKFINGIRVYTTSLVVMVHVCLIVTAGPVSNPLYLEKITENPLNMLLMNGDVAIQAFLILSGWLLAYHFFSRFENKKDLNYKYFILAFANRYIRLTPAYLVVIAISGTWLYHVNRGPFWDKLVGNEYRSCRKNWWANLLYINNHYDTRHMCIPQAWYLAADSQIFIISLMIIFLMWKYQHRIKFILGISMIISIVIPGLIHYIKNYDIVVRRYPETLYNILLDEEQWHIITIAGITNIGGYVIGIGFGYLSYKTNKKNLFTNKVCVAIWWIVTWTLPLGVVFMGILFYQKDYEHTRFGAALYAALGRNIYALGIAVGFFGISQKIGWFLRDCVLWEPLQVLGRITYCIYLVHIALIRIQAGEARSPTYMSSYMFLINTLGHVFISHIFGTMLCLFVELPISALQKLLLPETNRHRDDRSKKED